MTNDIWCLFSVENNYDQPDDNLVAFWQDKPTAADLSERFRPDIVEDLLAGQTRRVSDTDYRIEKRSPGFQI